MYANSISSSEPPGLLGREKEFVPSLDRSWEDGESLDMLRTGHGNVRYRKKKLFWRLSDHDFPEPNLTNLRSLLSKTETWNGCDFGLNQAEQKPSTVNPRISAWGAYFFKFRRRRGRLFEGVLNRVNGRGYLIFPNRGLTWSFFNTSPTRKQKHKLF